MSAVRLILAAFALTGAMLLIVPLATAWWPGGLTGYFAALTLYWTLFCIPVALATRAASGRRSLSLRGALWVPVVVLGQVALLGIYAAANGFFALPAAAYGLGVVAALVNAPLEELAWRGAYFAVAPLNPLIQAAGVWLFTLWHLPLMLASGVDFGAEPFTIMTAVFTLGCAWAIITWRTRSLAWPILGHTLTNMIAFPALIAANT